MQDFPALGVAFGGVTPFSVNASTQSPTFNGSGSVTTGPVGSLTLTNPSPNSLVVQGGTAYSATTASGAAATFELFPPPPTGWTITDVNHDQQCQIALTNATTRTLIMTITQLSTSTTLATATLDQSGSGTITYSDGSTAAITNWTVAD